MADLTGPLFAGGITASVASAGFFVRWLRRERGRRRVHTLDHEGRPERKDPSTGQVIEKARPGIAAQLDNIIDTVEKMHHRQGAIGDKMDTVEQRLTEHKDFSGKIDEIHDMLAGQKHVNEIRHEQNRTQIEQARATAEGSRADVAELRLAVRDTQQAVASTAEHVTRVEGEIATRFEEHMVVEQTYARALAELGINVEPPTRP